jgi:hypothetical protein
MKQPNKKQAIEWLNEAETQNPGPWVQHSLFVAQAAEEIAARHPRLNAEWAFVFGCLHDIGRRAGVFDMRHILDGYYFLTAQGFDDAARICLTHSFPIKNIKAAAAKWDCSPQEMDFITRTLSECEYNEYDRLIQLCDALALPSGYCLIEKRLVDVALRHGVNEYSVPRWKAYLELQKEFEAAIGQSIYPLMPGVVENTFG